MTQPYGCGSLRELREGRGLTQQDLAEAVAGLAWAQNQRAVGVNADMVSKWERGAKVPSRLYVRLLSTFFGLAVPDFCVMLQSTGSATTTKAPLVVLSSSSDPACTLGSGVGKPRSEDSVRRRSMLRLMGLAPLSVVLTPTGVVGSTFTNSSTELASLESISMAYQRLYRVTDPEALLLALTGHLRCVSAQLAESRDRAVRARLLTSLGQVALLAGRLAFFDLGDAHVARGHLTAALEAARETGDRLLEAGVLGHASFLAAAQHSYRVASDYLAAAAASASGAEARPIRSWLSAVEAEINTKAGQRDAAWRALDHATAMLANPGVPVPIWFDFYDASRLDGFKGNSYLAFGRTAEARSCLQRSLDALPAESTKQRSVVLTDLATVHLHDNEVQEACRTAGIAVDALRSAGYATGKDRLLGFLKRLEGLGGRREVRVIDDQLSLL